MGMEKIGTEVGNSINPELIDRALENAERQEASEASREGVNGRSLSSRLARQVALAMAFLAPVVGIAQTNETPGKTLSKEEQKIETKKNIQLAKLKAEIEIAQKKRELSEVGKKGNPEPIATASGGEIGSTYAKDTTNKKVAFRKIETDDGKGNKTVAFEGTRDGAKLAREEININRPTPNGIVNGSVPIGNLNNRPYDANGNPHADTGWELRENK